MLNARVEKRGGLPHLLFLRAEKPELRRMNRGQSISCAAQGLHLDTPLFPGVKGPETDENTVAILCKRKNNREE